MIYFAEKALDQIDFQLLNRLEEEAKQNRIVSHRDVANHNFLINKNVWLIDFDLSSFEPQILDLWQFINRVMLEQKWDIHIFENIKDIYIENRKLRDNEKLLIHQLSLFPNEFLREAIGPFLHPKKYNKKNAFYVVNNFLENYEKYLYFQKNILLGFVCLYFYYFV